MVTYQIISRCQQILNSYRISFGFNLGSQCQQEVRTGDISAGQQLLCKTLLKKHLYLSPKATDAPCKASRATNRNQLEEVDFEPTALQCKVNGVVLSHRDHEIRS